MHIIKLTSSVSFLGVHVFGLCATALVTDIIQLSTGYQAPYFLTVCKPNYTSLNVSCSENSYVVEDICSGADLNIINAGRLVLFFIVYIFKYLFYFLFSVPISRFFFS